MTQIYDVQSNKYRSKHPRVGNTNLQLHFKNFLIENFHRQGLKKVDKEQCNLYFLAFVSKKNVIDHSRNFVYSGNVLEIIIFSALKE